MPHLKHGMIFLLLSLALVSCRESKAPIIDQCTGDGFGGANCVLKDNTRVYLSPMQLKNYWISSPQDMNLFVAWCYDVPPAVAEQHLEALKREKGLQ